MSAALRPGSDPPRQGPGPDDLPTRFAAAYRGPHDPADALAWLDEPVLPGPSGAPPPGAALAKQRTRLYRRQATPADVARFEAAAWQVGRDEVLARTALQAALSAAAPAATPGRAATAGSLPDHAPAPDPLRSAPRFVRPAVVASAIGTVVIVAVVVVGAGVLRGIGASAAPSAGPGVVAPSPTSATSATGPTGDGASRGDRALDGPLEAPERTVTARPLPLIGTAAQVARLRRALAGQTEGPDALITGTAIRSIPVLRNARYLSESETNATGSGRLDLTGFDQFRVQRTATVLVLCTRDAAAGWTMRGVRRSPTDRSSVLVVSGRIAHCGRLSAATVPLPPAIDELTVEVTVHGRIRFVTQLHTTS